ncbi:hydrolase [Longispora fulva]|uniref:Glyoxylase-like metal-dependent hydrolase (Beta-lactamase superfamily II) n=1 Tax=Longispora fulva TaxID=619741 RepID=A0A8J7GIJ5_9ACTN|nr:MBL fold metallo-hydrolase [Longispora fulva]MBG6141288.1 glyoxylase-like metal-dependent hydrolase (beta-lactamase superfamily II) [Longispora fulva]GIG62715.1 hydrolase [Longispora fulva]
MDTHETTDLIIRKLSVGSFDNNAYLLRCRRTGQQLLIDAAAEPDRLLELVGPDGLATVVTTHRHPDHWQGLAEVLAATGAASVAHADDIEGLPVAAEPSGATVRVGEVDLEVIHLVGHTPGSIALHYRDPAGVGHLFTGDSLFPGGVGNTQGDADRFASLIHDVRTKLFDRLADDTVVYPGHGADTTLGRERPSIPEWVARGW